VLRKCILCVAGVAVIAFALGAAACNKSSDERKPGPATRRAVPRTAPGSRVIELVELDIGVGPDTVTRATPGLPKGLKPPHLRAEGKRAAFMVTPGMKNLALYKTVTASEEPIVGDVDQITDGIKKSGKFDRVELSQRGWVQIDLGRPQTIHAVVIWHFYKNATIYNDVIVRLADDAAFTQNVRTLFNNDHDNSVAMGEGGDKAFYTRWWGEIVDARGENHAGTPARYVRVYTGDGWEGEPPRFVEVSVYGKEK
jgi:hypothetical protein